MEIKQLEVFCAVVEKRSFSLAGQKLGLTQPSVSFQISSLESELGARLLDRGGRTVSLTKSGEVLHHYACLILQMVDEARQAIHNLKGLLWGDLKIGASTIPGEYVLPPLLQKFREVHPGLTIEMAIGDTRGVIGKVSNNEVDLGVVGAIEKNEALVFTRFISDRLILITPFDNPWVSSDSIRLEQLANMPFVLREKGSGTWSFVERRLRDAGFELDALKVSLVVGSTEAVKRAVESGAGVSIVSERAVSNQLRLGLIKRVEIENLELTRDFFIVYRRQKSLSPAAEALLAFLLESNGNWAI